jgi:ABC-2 type transport system ATP-binding protein/lipopolysaccharide transport system ATP-binding protein
VRLLNGSGEERFVFHPDEGVEIVIPFAWRESLSGELVFGLGVHHGDGTLLFGTNTHIEQVTLNFSERSNEVRCHIPRLSLLDGEYWLDIAAHREDGYPYDYWKKALKFSVRSSRAQVGKVFLETQWSVIDEGSDIESTQDRVPQSRAVS